MQRFVTWRFQVPISIDCLRMRICKTYIIFSHLLWILMWQATSTSCASLEMQNYSLKSFDFSASQRNFAAPKNLSEIIEFSPLNLPEELESATAFHQDEKDSTPKIITVRVKTQVFVENRRNSNQTGSPETNEALNTSKSNASHDPLSEIEYLDTDQSENQDSLKLNLHTRSTRMIFTDEKKDVPDNSSDESKNSSEEDISYGNMYISKDSEENQVSREVHRSKYATGRQFLFHPYLPYGKDIPPDEKISFHDVLPVKMVKFVKSMVEEADWNGMFKSMVRTVVDHFVNKIIEKMFTEKDDHDLLKRRSLDLILGSAFVLPTFKTPVVRLKRSVTNNNNPGQDDDDIFSFLPPKRKPQEVDKEGEKKSADERKTWLDHFLDFVFPNSKSDESGEDSFDRLKKRDTSNSQLLKILVAFFLNTVEKSTEFLADAKDVLRYKMLKEYLPYIYQKRYVNPNGTNNSVDAMKMTHRKFTENVVKRNDIEDHLSGSSVRSKRSANDKFRKDEGNRLWQSHTRRHGPHSYRSRDECSLRKACNAGRLLSRLPSVQDITLQLRSTGDEPHWDALIWGMKRKRCSRIFCKRQRSPKGSKHSWNSDKERLSKTVEIVTEPPDDFDESHNLTI